MTTIFHHRLPFLYPRLQRTMSTAPSLKQAKPVKTKTPYQLTPEQVALQKARAELKAQKAAVKAEEPLRTQAQIDKGKFLKREWVDLLQSDKKDEGAVRVLSWNVLAQTLIRVFPVALTACSVVL